MKKQKGFTLIELLVVIAIIGTLTTAAMAGLNSARSKGRDARRLSDIKSLQKALDMYLDTCGGYPLLGDGAYVPVGESGGLESTTQDGNCEGGSDTLGLYMSILPVNPSPGGKSYTYCSSPEDAPLIAASCSIDDTTTPPGNGSYQFTFTLENGSGNLTAGDYVATPKGIQPAP